jgi:hypothetical protein
MKGILMSTPHIRSGVSLARTAVISTSAGFVALTLAGPVSAETAKAVFNGGWSVDCSGGKPMGDCDLVERSFTNAVDKLKISVTQGNSFCAQSIAEIYVDGQNHPSRRIGTWQQEPLTISVTPGYHQIKLNLRSLGSCKDGVPPAMTGNLLVEELVPDTQTPDRPVKSLRGVPAVVQAPQGVDVYDAVNVPDGVATKTGTLADGSGVTVLGVCGDTADQVNPEARPSQLTANKWCRVEGPAVPNGGGFIWGHLAPR